MDNSKYLKQSVVFRGPATSPLGPEKEETKTIIFSPDRINYGNNPRRGAFLFNIVQGSGGNSSIELLIGQDDWRTILESLAELSPPVRKIIEEIAANSP